MDELDQEILMQLKEDSRRTVTEISKAIGRSHSATRVRVNNLMKSVHWGLGAEGLVLGGE